ncbi:LysR family transcriptional regulator [Pseudoalteromonas piscicida]|uniref:LysR family transcriptional regulator n=1 Tax=Pseudoalteromonas piscicida TaxID=43662 RepID=A0A2A5JSG9_PSEO7|nr:LysR family transcriptional regulator [Pseudoalteromonas piscicida]PCK32403.1 LysR family transcriptional regulator [Pseudoalteromonas piscicida]
MIDQIDHQWLKSFHCVYECLSFKQAAEFLGIPTSNVSRHIALLEEKLNARLLERTTRRISVTEAGEQLYSSTKPLTESLSDALQEVNKHACTPIGHLRILMPDIPILGQAVVTFCAENPLISISCDTSLSPRENLLDGFDVVLYFHRGKLEDSNWVVKELTRLPSVVVAAPSLLEQQNKPYRLSDLQTLPCISTLTAVNGTPWIFKTKEGKLTTVHVKSNFRVNSGFMAKSAALSGVGFAILPLDSCNAEIESGDLISVCLEQQPEDLVLYAFYAGRKHLAKKISAFLAHLEAALQ